MIVIPQNGQFRQTNKSDVLGNLQGTFNLDFTKVLGKTRVTRMIQTTTQGTDTNMTSYPVGFKVFNANTIFTVAGSRVHSNSGITNAAFVVDGSGGSPTDCSSTYSDIEIFNAAAYVTANQKLYQYNGGWSNASFGSSSPAMMTVFQSRLYITAGSKVFSTADGSTIATSSTYTLSLDTQYLVTFVRSSSNRVWVGTLNINGGKGYIYEWDGTTANPTKSYRMEAQGALACVIKDDIPWVVDTNGKLLQFSNGTFSEVARFPIENKLLLNATSTVNNRFIHPNGMTIVNGKINILINNVVEDNASTITEFCPSGIWEYDDIIYDVYTGTSLGIGLYHKYSLSYLPVGTNTITDYGQNRVSGVGGLSDMKITNTAASATGNLLAGAVIYKDASATDSGVFTTDTFDATSGTTGQYNTTGNGYIVTTKQFAQDEKGNPSIQNLWQTIFTLYRKLITTNSEMEVKYRTVEIIPLEASITWTSTTTFTTTTNVLGLETYEVEGIQGTGSGQLSHISKIDVTGGTYTVTVDDPFTGVTGTGKVRIQNWKRISQISQSGATYDQAGMGDLSNWIQFKIGMTFSSKDELEKLLIINENGYPAK